MYTTERYFTDAAIDYFIYAAWHVLKQLLGKHVLPSQVTQHPFCDGVHNKIIGVTSKHFSFSFTFKRPTNSIVRGCARKRLVGAQGSEDGSICLKELNAR